MMRKLIVGLVAGAALVTVACGQSGQPAHRASKPSHHPTPSVAASTSSRHVPLKLRIPAISVDSPVEQVGVDKDGNMDVPKQLGDVAWYSPGVAPGEPGDAVIAGHKDSETGAPAVFWSLTDLKVGDQLVVMGQDGATLKFKVTQTRTVAATADPSQLGLFAKDGPPRLTLITCTGQTNSQRTAYLERLVVDASLER
jgi:LPXTG-site transpeptidase (sortase) family protein